MSSTQSSCLMASYKPTPTETARFNDLTCVSSIGILTMAPPVSPAAACACNKHHCGHSQHMAAFLNAGCCFIVSLLVCALTGTKKLVVVKNCDTNGLEGTSLGNPVVSAPNISQSPGWYKPACRTSSIHGCALCRMPALAMPDCMHTQ